MKFQDSEEITNVELADAFEQMWQKRRLSLISAFQMYLVTRFLLTCLPIPTYGVCCSTLLVLRTKLLIVFEVFPS